MCNEHHMIFLVFIFSHTHTPQNVFPFYYDSDGKQVLVISANLVRDYAFMHSPWLTASSQ